MRKHFEEMSNQEMHDWAIIESETRELLAKDPNASYVELIVRISEKTYDTIESHILVSGIKEALSNHRGEKQ